MVKKLKEEIEKMKRKIIDTVLLTIAAIAIFLGFKVVIRDVPEEPEAPEKKIFYYVDPASVEQETDSYTVPD